MKSKYEIGEVRRSRTLRGAWFVYYVLMDNPDVPRSYLVMGHKAQDELAAYMFFKQLMERLGYETVTELQDA